ncbi:dimeric dihydrodiol dehydrogenase [Niveomyces insectorum RCEF 264]|uniref:D-xylose 1-dehydrogenase (NADP(+), D-xylono-1,5-lactone-forming) n=1 Tax=Niveomyces insectorum RCEF 264 TaxID=1081102 RepID=A0A162I958_9HYPO|nr:dimeric dihydrodiol dehydrogenase [Niveomyces insectorum RCEF 264]
MSSELPTVRWGIVATGLISSWFVEDLVLDRPDAKAKHIVQAIGSSSLAKGKAFAEKYLPGLEPTVYPSYEQVYNDASVDIVYIGTPHGFHKQNCLDAIRAGKHILCEKSFTLNAKEAREVFAAAKAKNVFVMEAMWLRFRPLTQFLHKLLYVDKVIGDVRRVFSDFGLDQDIKSLGPESRLRNPALGASTLLDIGIYSLTWGLLTLDAETGPKAQTPKIVAVQSLDAGVDLASTVILLYPNGGQGILTSATYAKTPEPFCRIEGSKGVITVEGPAGSAPEFLIVEPRGGDAQKHDFRIPGRGFYYEADAAALDVVAGRKENDIMPWSETIRVLEIMDEVRRQGGVVYPQDN